VIEGEEQPLDVNTVPSEVERYLRQQLSAADSNNARGK